MTFPWRKILEVIQEEEATLLVVGDPLSMSGESREASVAAREFAKELARRSGIACEMQDERLTSVEANRIFTQKGGRGRKRKEEVDRIAASIILQTWLDRRARQMARREEEEAG
jgi:putative Holliday junction resolvase